MIKKNNTDDVIDEIHETRRANAEKFGNNVSAIAEDARKRQAASGRKVWQPENLADEASDSADS